jgi:hypothetical protein
MNEFTLQQQESKASESQRISQDEMQRLIRLGKQQEVMQEGLGLLVGSESQGDLFG